MNDTPNPTPGGETRLEHLAERHFAQLHMSEHFANERTHLAYVRTAVSLVSFGITINRFSIFLIETAQIDRMGKLVGTMADMERLGIGMVVLGLSLVLWAGFRYQRVSKAIDQGRYQSNVMAMWIITIVVFLTGALSLIWLFAR